MVDGHVQRLSIDEISPFTVYEPSRWWRSQVGSYRRWRFAFAALLLTTLLWPVAVIVRRRNNLKLDLVGRDERGRLVSRVAAAVVTVVSLAWLAFVYGTQHEDRDARPASIPRCFSCT